MTQTQGTHILNTVVGLFALNNRIKILITAKHTEISSCTLVHSNKGRHEAAKRRLCLP